MKRQEREEGGTSRLLRAIYDEDLSFVAHSFQRLGVAARDVEDLTHDLLMVVLRHAEEYDPSRLRRAWVFGFVYRMAADYRKRASHRREVFDVDASPEDPGQNSFELAAQAEERRLLQRALALLDLELAAVFTMHDVEEMPMSEIARTLQIPPNTGYSRLRTARQEIVAFLRRYQSADNESPVHARRGAVHG